MTAVQFYSLNGQDITLAEAINNSVSYKFPSARL